MQPVDHSGMVLDPDTWQTQLDELVALSSILGQDFRLLEAGGISLDRQDEGDVAPEELYAYGPPQQAGSFSCEVLIHVDTPAEGLQLVIRTTENGASSSSSKPAAGNGAPPSSSPTASLSQAATGQTVKHVPPICMQLAFPPTYPAHAAPDVRLRAMWLRPSQVSHLQQCLQHVWEEGGPGTPVGYVWLEWLKANALQELGILQTHRLALGSQPACTSQAQRSNSRQGAEQPGANGHDGASTSAQPACSISSVLTQQEFTIPPEQLAVSMLRYSAHREHELFQTQICTCPVCFEEVLGAKCVRLPDCGHYVCRDCFTQDVKLKVQEGSVEQINCVDTSCRRPVPAACIQAVLTPAEHERWEALLLQRTLDKMEDVVYCPRCQTISLEDQQHCAQCPKCNYVFCGLCDDAWHPGSACLSPDQAIERKRERLERSGNMSVEERQRRHADLMGQYKSVAMVMASSKQCPSCHMAIQKSEGCNKMICGYCSTKFCFRCLKMIEDYDHFGSGKCELFDMDEIQRWNAQFDNANMERYWHVAAAGFMVREARRQGGNNMQRFAPCTTCGQFNMKDGNNNLMRCFACNSYFCYTCRQTLRYKPGSHFGPGANKCKQHSDD